MSKRGQNEGSIYKRDDGRWVAAISLGLVGGKNKRKYIYGDTRKEVQEQLTRALRDVQQGIPIAPERQTVEQYLTKWLEESIKPRRAPKTYFTYKQNMRLYLLPDLGSIQLAKLSPQDVQAFINRHLALGLAPRTMQIAREVLRTALNQAMRWGLVVRNVAALVEAPYSERKEQDFLTPEEASAFLNAVQGERLEALYTVALALGLRKGEALGLRWKDVDFENRTITSRVALQRLPGGTFYIKDLKTHKSRRQLALPEFAVKVLQKHRESQLQEKAAFGELWQNEWDLVFTSGLGTPLYERNVTRRFHQLLQKAGLARIRFYDMRHTCGALLISQGVHPRVVMEILGHSQISVTMNTYGHVIPTSRLEAADKLDMLFNHPEK